MNRSNVQEVVFKAMGERVRSPAISNMRTLVSQGDNFSVFYHLEKDVDLDMNVFFTVRDNVRANIEKQ